MPLRILRLAAAAVAALSLFACASADQQAASAPEAVTVGRARNPVFPAADPHLAVAQGRWWIYATTPDAAGRPSWARLYAHASDDLTRWTRIGPIFSFQGVRWIGDDDVRRHYLWAPALAEANGRFYLYYSVGPQNPTPSRIGVAVADTPEGPFTDTGKPLLTGVTGVGEWEAIDPMVFTDPRTGIAYLYAGGSAGSKLHVFELEPTMTAVRREVRVEQPPNFTEGPFMHERNGVYYLSYSHGRWYDASYSAHYATAPSPVGPWAYRGVLLRSDERHRGPGHHSIARNPATGEWFIAYHRWEAAGRRTFQGDRQVAVQRLTYNPDGTIAPVQMDDAPPPSSPLAAQSKAAAIAGSSLPGGTLEPASAR
ncbi:MAG TPA: family 43 glycosylhydrolase [Caulobacteraceae bacterium]|jgi:beta-xylosidase